MAVIQISKIQHRRGQKNQGSGIPQLASGELGWAIDAQELYIGNGAVSEGAPSVGNTQVLTQNSDIFQFLDDYVYKQDSGIVQTSNFPLAPIQRTLQERLDERVTIRSFDALGDGTDQTVKLQRAIDQLYLNAATKGSYGSRVILILPAGEYVISSTIYVPPYMTLLGAGIDKTLIRGTTASPLFQTVNSSSTPGVYASDTTSTTLNQAKFIRMEGMTLQTIGLAKAFILQSCSDSQFRDLKVIGDWTSSDGISTGSAGFEFNALSTVVSSNRNNFQNVTVEGYSYAALSDYDITDNLFDTMTFNTLGYGVAFGENTTLGNLGQLTGPLRNKIVNSEFSNVDRSAVWVNNGKYNLSKGNTYVNVGNDGGVESNATYPVLQFADKSNISVADYFSRTSALSYSPDFITGNPCVPEIAGTVVFDSAHFHEVTLSFAATATRLFKLPADSNKSYRIEYHYKSTAVTASRSGVIDVNVDFDNDATTIVDDYNYNGDAAFSTNLKFQSNLTDEDSNSIMDTLDITYTNPTASDQATLLFKVTTFSIA